MTVNVTIEGETDEILDQRTREIVNIFYNDLECEVIAEDRIGLGLCLIVGFFTLVRLVF